MARVVLVLGLVQPRGLEETRLDKPPAILARATLISRTELAPNVQLVEVAMRDPRELRFRAGQFVTFLLPEPGKRDLAKRAFSIASSPSRRDRFELLVKLVLGGLASEWLMSLRPGEDDMPFVGPEGHFIAAERHPGDVIFVATGTGIAAARPIIEEILERPAPLEGGAVRLYWGLRRPDDIYWQDRLASLEEQSDRFRYSIHLSRPGEGWQGAQGRITEHVLDGLSRWRDPTFYLVGNGDMVREMRNALVDQGVDRRERIRTEIFYPTEETT